MQMERKMLISVDSECADLFRGFEKEGSDDLLVLENRGAVAFDVVEVLINLTPHLLTALTAYLVARVQNRKSDNEIRIKKGDLEINLKNANITPEYTLALLEKLESNPKSRVIANE